VVVAVVLALITVGRFSLVVGLSRVVEALRESAASAASALVEGEAGAAAAAEATATAAAKGSSATHHGEQDLGVNAAMHAAAAAAKHV
jgi:hypothetical protein